MSMPKIECQNVDKCCAASSLLQSIALEESAISHILNAEGEKLQKAIALGCDAKDLLKVNKSVEDMVDKITSLEIVLKSKLDLIKPILDDCNKHRDCDKHCDCDKHHDCNKHCDCDKHPDCDK